MISLNNRDSRPIYEQIKDSLRRLLITGAISEGERLPSVRELASRLAINPNTIQRAYRELESEGYIYSAAGKGSFAARVSEVDAKRKNELLKCFDDAALELFHLGFGTEELKKRVEAIVAALEVREND